MSTLSGRVLFTVAILLVGLNLRPTMAAIGPMLDAIQRDTGLTDAGASLLTTLPITLMGVCLLATGKVKALLGERQGIALGLGLILLSNVLRWDMPSATLLLVTATLGGIGIAIVQALLPIVIRHRAGPRTAAVMALYTTGIMGGAFLSGTASPWIAGASSWSTALGVWAIPALMGGLVWWAATTAADSNTGAAPRRPVSRQPRAWLLMAFFGLGTGAYTLVLAWLPPFYTALGWSAEAAGLMLGLVTLAEVVAGLGISFWVNRTVDRRPALCTAIGFLLVGILGFIVVPLPLAWPSAILTGLGIGALFPLGLIVAMDHGESANDAGAIAGFVQGGGYVVAAVLPLLAGVLRQTLSDLTPAWGLMAGLCLVMGLIAIRLRPGHRITFSA
ncbi:CynX/NimT family MFS transporter [Roseospira marina]|uniref:CynX/NimT family MFS transporter n=1 Tax=Roseospira marina TaxID=140057 RepID=A0A5M6I9B1_9PROT|nr:MFS transporter [Roseospira marina]KAA5604810.1 CynX/NimT family MFS transporter [Roseospira marina]MBB4313501.1 CP family cyanate transporter-like MFS transporter [Roseospira marina]MBB5086663.1 CP family cyanate transporter-like MFS transporter [Roseospira marina]